MVHRWQDAKVEKSKLCQDGNSTFPKDIFYPSETLLPGTGWFSSNWVSGLYGEAGADAGPHLAAQNLSRQQLLVDSMLLIFCRRYAGP